MTGSSPRESHLMTVGEVARVFRVSPKAVSRWARKGKLTSFRTPSGHRRYIRAEVVALATDWRKS